MVEINYLLAFGAGLLSFVSPCSLPLYPAFLSYITGMSVNDLKNNKHLVNKGAVVHTLLFLTGFSLIFLALGLSTSFIGSFFFVYQDLLRQLGAIVLVFFGCVLTGMLKFDFLMKEKKFQFQKRPSGYLGSILIGVAFAAGWTPCTGPILAAVMAMGITDPGKGLSYMLFYVLGFAIPFLVLSLFIGRMSFLQRNSNLFMKLGGVLMILMGILLYFDMMIKIISFLTGIFGGFTGF
ncbi:cytochrome C biogenesis protein CcdA [Chryseomicrobium excrementi]|uniref:Cytochrome C biogenesis protein CcdA n=1 Tax=Chryseomicrobium excrementi TaxID=2041346 RepID=A0A2M9EZC8_9BACL|nr:cytochrome c biogenesis protein CcdA [Chryseomicrobium excrementi]PJK16563.1 cytochrome C biogenesis protein CcdA [Chryseomicrobium excrementi]